MRVNVRQGFYCIAVRLTKWCISQTSAMLFAPVHGGCYIISSVGIEYSCQQWRPDRVDRVDKV